MLRDHEEPIKAQTEVAKSVWDGHDDEAYRSDQSHWRGVGRWADDARWQRIGIRSRATIGSALRLYGLDRDFWTAPRSYLEWGPGGGANAFAFKDIAANYYGVDIAQKNLNECQRMLRAEGSEVLRPVLVREDPEEVLAAVTHPIDVFLSTAVFQHFPSQAYGKRVLEVMHKLMCPSGVGVVQIRYDNGDANVRPIETLDQYKERHIFANSYTLEVFSQVLQEVGFADVMVSDIFPPAKYATFWFRKPG